MTAIASRPVVRRVCRHDIASGRFDREWFETEGVLGKVGKVEHNPRGQTRFETRLVTSIPDDSPRARRSRLSRPCLRNRLRRSERNRQSVPVLRSDLLRCQPCVWMGHGPQRHRSQPIHRRTRLQKMLETSPHPGYHLDRMDASAAWQMVGVQLSSVLRTTIR